MSFTADPCLGAVRGELMKLFIVAISGCRQFVRFAGSAIAILFVLGTLGQSLDTSVLVSQDGHSDMPLDVTKPIIYNIQLFNPAKYTMCYTVDLEVGPDMEDMSISKSFLPTEIRLDAASSTSVKFELEFQYPYLMRGEFKNWRSNETLQEQKPEWDNAWYKLTITSANPFETIEPIEGFGSPILEMPIWELRNPKVTPNSGTDRDFYEYKVEVFSSTTDNITLKVGPSREGPWTLLGTREYATPRTWQTLNWSNESLDFKFGAAAFTFVGQGGQEDPDSPFDGPYWPIDIEFKNANVTPTKGQADTVFTYNIDFNASSETDVVLNVLDITTDEYFSAGRVTYTNVGAWETLNFEDIKVTNEPEACGSSRYYFSIYYPGFEGQLATTLQRIGRYYPGPDITVGDIRANVTPFNGTAHTPFTYYAVVDTSRPVYNIELEISPPGSKVWEKMGAITHSVDEDEFVWPGVTFEDMADSDAMGMASYRFLMDGVLLGEFRGPNIDVVFNNATWEVIGKTDRFNYMVTVCSLRPELDIEMVYTDDGTNYVRSGLVQKYESDEQACIQLVWKNQPWHQGIYFDEVRT